MAFLTVKQNNTTRVLPFFMVLSSDHITGATGKSPTVKLGKNGAAAVSPSGTITEVDSVNLPGWYQVAANSTDANTLGSLELHATATGCDPADYLFDVVVYNPDDAVRLGLTALPNAAAGATGGLDVEVLLGGTASAGSLTTITLAGGIATDSIYNHACVKIVSGTGQGQVRTIVGYVGSTKVATVGRNWMTNPDNTSVFTVIGPAVMPATNLLDGTASAGTSATITLAGGVATDSLYVGATVAVMAGTGARQSRVITAYVGSTKVATVDRAWQITPDSTSVFVVWGTDAPATDASLQIAANAVNGSVTGSVGSVAGNVGGNVVGSVASVTAAVDILQTAADKVWSSATRTLTAISTAILGGVWEALRSGHTTVGSFGEGVASVQGSVTGSVASVTGAVGSVTGAVTLSAGDSPVIVSGTASAGAASSITLAGASATDQLYRGETVKITGGTGAGQTRAITDYIGSTKVATLDRPWATNPDNTSVFTVLATDVPKVDVSGQVTAASVQGNVTGSVASVTAAVDILQSAADKVWSSATRTLTAFGFSVTVGTNNDKGGYALSAAGVQAIWDALTSALTTVGSIGKRLVDNIDAAISSRLATSAITLSSGAVTVGTNNDKTGYGLSSLESAVLASGTASSGGASTITLAGAAATDSLYVGELVKVYGGTGAGQTRVITAYVGATKVATVDHAWATNPDNTSLFAVLVADAPKLDSSLQTTAGSVVGSVASVTGNVGGNVVGSVGSVAAPVTVGTNNDKTGYSLSAAGIQAIWDALTSALTTVGSVGKRIADNLDAAISSRLASGSVTVGVNNDKTGYSLANNAVDAAQFTQAAADKVWNSAARSLTAAVDILQTAADKVWASVARTLTAFGFNVTVAVNNDKTGYTVATNQDKTGYSLVVTPPTAAEIDTQLSGTHGSGQWGIGVGGVGANSVTLTVQSTTNVPIAGVSVTVKDNAQTVVLAFGVTDSSGKVFFNLNNGTYQVLILSTPLYTSPPAQTLVVSGTTTATYSLASFNPGVPASASLCRIFGTIRKLDGTPAANVSVSFSLRPTTAYKVNDTAIVVKEMDVVTDVNGFFFADLTRSSQFSAVAGSTAPQYVVYAADAQLHHSFSAPDASSADLFSLPLVAS